jgi:hypothetical protein
VDLNEQPKYEALSYAWQNQSKPHRLVVDRQWQIPITEPLYKALRDLRPSLSPIHNDRRKLWVDAVSINQDDVKERNSQVQKMGGIYRSAGQVVLHVPEEYVDLRPAIDVIKGFDRCLI